MHAHYLLVACTSLTGCMHITYQAIRDAEERAREVERLKAAEVQARVEKMAGDAASQPKAVLAQAIQRPERGVRRGAQLVNACVHVHIKSSW